jgi:hypothetical protein
LLCPPEKIYEPWIVVPSSGEILNFPFPNACGTAIKKYFPMPGKRSNYVGYILYITSSVWCLVAYPNTAEAPKSE